VLVSAEKPATVLVAGFFTRVALNNTFLLHQKAE
jgi:hypothetical protein